MLTFDANIYAYPTTATVGDSVVIRGESLTPLCDAERRPPIFDAFLPVTFEQAYEALVQLPRLDAEPDGFLVIAGEADGSRWQLDGHLYDFGDSLHRLRLHGQCPDETLYAVLQCLGWPEAQVAFEVISDGVVLDESNFRRYAARRPIH